MSVQVKITIAEPSDMIRTGISAILKRWHGFHVELFEVNDIGQLRNTLNWQRPDILIIDPSSLGLFSVSQIRKEAANSEMKMVALQLSLSDSAILKSYDDSISIYDGAEAIKEKLSRLIHKPERDKRHESLSLREKEVVACVVQGMTNKQIADRLCLSTHTVITHRRNISSKLDIRSTAGLTIYAIVNKLVDLGSINDGGGAEE